MRSPRGATETDTGLQGLGIKLMLCRLVLFLECLWQAAWPSLAVVSLFVGLALLDLFKALPGWLHIGLLLIFIAALAASLRYAVKRFKLPDLLDARDRLEENSGLSHRPLTTLADNLLAGEGDRESEALWKAHLKQVRARLKRIPVGAPRPILAKADPYGIAALTGLLLFLGLVAGSWEWQGRLLRAFEPRLAVADTVSNSFDAWINPPAYTNLPPVFLDPEVQETLEIVTGSTLLAHAQSPDRPLLKIDEQEFPFETFSREAHKIEHSITAGTSLAIEVGSEVLGRWPITLLGDTPPSVSFTQSPKRTERMSLRLEYEAADDFGLAGLRAVVNRIDKPEEAPIELELVLPGGNRKSAKGVSYHDLTAHRWAGLAVEIRLVAIDALGQEGLSELARSVLPERIFNHPVARALVELRKQLSLEPDNRYPVVRSIGRIADQPGDYDNDFTVALALHVAARRLVHDTSDSAVIEVQDLLWNSALRIEEGELAVAERELRDAQQALLDALSEGAENAEIEQLLDELQAALDKFLETLAEQLRADLENGQELPPPDGPSLDSQDLRDMIEKARDLARSGARDAARDLLSQLQEMLENLRAQPFAQFMSEAQKQASQMMRDMDRMLDRQQELLDRSHKRSRERDPDASSQQSQQQGNRRDGICPRRTEVPDASDQHDGRRIDQHRASTEQSKPLFEKHSPHNAPCGGFKGQVLFFSFIH